MVKKLLNKEERIARWDWTRDKWDMKDQIKTTNKLLKAGILKEKNAVSSGTKSNIHKLAIGINEDGLIAHQMLTNILIMNI